MSFPFSAGEGMNVLAMLAQAALAGQPNAQGTQAQRVADMAGEQAQGQLTNEYQEKLRKEQEKAQKKDGLSKIASAVVGTAASAIPVVGPVAGPIAGSLAGDIVGGGEIDPVSALGAGLSGVPQVAQNAIANNPPRYGYGEGNPVGPLVPTGGEKLANALNTPQMASLLADVSLGMQTPSPRPIVPNVEAPVGLSPTNRAMVDNQMREEFTAQQQALETQQRMQIAQSGLQLQERGLEEEIRSNQVNEALGQEDLGLRRTGQEQTGTYQEGMLEVAQQNAQTQADVAKATAANQVTQNELEGRRVTVAEQQAKLAAELPINVGNGYLTRGEDGKYVFSSTKQGEGFELPTVVGQSYMAQQNALNDVAAMRAKGELDDAAANAMTKDIVRNTNNTLFNTLYRFSSAGDEAGVAAIVSSIPPDNYGKPDAQGRIIIRNADTSDVAVIQPSTPEEAAGVTEILMQNKLDPFNLGTAVYNKLLQQNSNPPAQPETLTAPATTAPEQTNSAVQSNASNFTPLSSSPALDPNALLNEAILGQLNASAGWTPKDDEEMGQLQAQLDRLEARPVSGGSQAQALVARNLDMEKDQLRGRIKELAERKRSALGMSPLANPVLTQ